MKFGNLIIPRYKNAHTRGKYKTVNDAARQRWCPEGLRRVDFPLKAFPSSLRAYLVNFSITRTLTPPHTTPSSQSSTTTLANISIPIYIYIFRKQKTEREYINENLRENIWRRLCGVVGWSGGKYCCRTRIAHPCGASIKTTPLECVGTHKQTGPLPYTR